MLIIISYTNNDTSISYFSIFPPLFSFNFLIAPVKISSTMENIYGENGKLHLGFGFNRIALSEKLIFIEIEIKFMVVWAETQLLYILMFFTYVDIWISIYMCRCMCVWNNVVAHGNESWGQRVQTCSCSFKVIQQNILS